MSTATALGRAPALDVAMIRAQFPILRTRAHGQPLVYLDSAASTQKPQCVIDEIKRFYEEDYANIHRGVYDLSQRASSAHDAARRKIQSFINARDWREIVFTRNATEAINLVAQSFARPKLGPGDEILVTAMEHHADIVPWQMVALATGAKLVVAPITEDGELDMAGLRQRLGPRTRMVGVAWVSNVLGTINPVHEIVRLAHAAGAPVLLDAAQAVQHLHVDVQDVGADFIAFSGHKLYGPSGTGVLWGKAEHLDAMPPWQGGGDMIERVTFAGTTWNEIPFKFEAGTPDIAGIVALGRAIDWISEIGLERIERHEHGLLAYATRALNQVPGLRLIGTAREKCSVLSFTLDGVHAHDIGTLLDFDGVAIRTGQQCAMPLHDRLDVMATARASIGIYNDTDDIDTLVASLRRVATRFG